MQLIKVGLQGYARFRERQELDVDAPLIAIVGPNEAGKTSLLRALLSLNDNTQFSEREPSRDHDAPEIQVWGRYVLDDEDRAAMPAEARAARQVVVTKERNGVLTYAFEPSVNRLQPKRVANVERVRRELPSPLSVPLEEAPDDRSREVHVHASVVREALDALEQNDDDTIDHRSRRQLESLRDGTRELGLEVLAEALDDLVSYETHHPFDTAVEVTTQRRPAFVQFTTDDRDLADRTSMDEAPNGALHNLLALGETSFGELVAAEPDRGRLRGLLERANAKLDDALGAWGQSRLQVELDVDDRVVHVLVRTLPAEYIEFSRRSAGLRMFVALRAFVARRQSAVPPILLIDEAEVHLHYDAQADLVRVLAEQDETSGVIYTTHSVGCLPADLGTGVRAVEPREGNDSVDRSRLVTNFFESEHGIRPLLVALGAGTFAMALRRAVFVEGISDAILLPVLLRQVTGADEMDFQVLPGISKAGAQHARELEAAATVVGYLLDADDAGVEKRQRMIDVWDIPGERVLLLPEDLGGLGGTTLEDVLEEGVYRRAVEVELGRWTDGVDVSDLVLPARDRSGAVRDWAQGKGLSVPDKAAVAARVLEQRRDGDGQPVQLVASKFRVPLRELATALAAVLAA